MVPPPRTTGRRAAIVTAATTTSMMRWKSQNSEQRGDGECHGEQHKQEGRDTCAHPNDGGGGRGLSVTTTTMALDRQNRRVHEGAMVRRRLSSSCSRRHHGRHENSEYGFWRDGFATTGDSMVIGEP